MQKLSTGALLLVTISTTAFAADLPSRLAPPVYIPPPVLTFTWTGLYVGAQVGYEFGHDTSALYSATGPGLVGFNVGSTNGVIGGAHIGYNYALNSFGSHLFGGALVVGLEGDVDGSSNDSSQVFGALAEAHQSNIEGSVRGRIGIAVDRALFYATGGAAFAGFNDTYSTSVGTDSESTTRVGWTIGGGVEYAITQHWSLRAEYRYSDFGNISYGPLTNSFAGLVGATNKPTEERVQVGFSYKFDTPALSPVVARY